ncbi:MAG TPA: cytidine deaminase [Streptosporangiaceae bacterium]|nr:cytidine deaminase [Streptosporangiaceae bacterium]
MSTDWPALRAAATAAAGRAYAPYSGLRVGAAGLTDDGRIIVASNVENASFGLTLCAECGLVSALHGAGPADKSDKSDQPDQPDQWDQSGQSGPTELVAVAVVAGDGDPLLPCGRCRQLLLEAGGGNLLVDTADGPVELKVLLPAAFTTTDLAERREQETSERETK